MFEKVNPCHPDKVADRIADAMVDLAYKKSENPRIAVEVLIGHGVCHIIAETSAPLAKADVTAAVHRIAGIMWKYRRTDTLPTTRQTESAAVITAFLRECP